MTKSVDLYAVNDRELIVVPLRLYIGDCPSISEGKVRGSEVQKRVQGSQRSILEISLKDDFQIKEIRLHYMSFIL